MIARVPGKLVIAGEYAVLFGGVSIVAAVDRYVEVRPHDGPYQVEGAEFKDTDRWIEVVAEHVHEAGQLDGVEVDVSQFYREGAKLGLGSSAASTVGIVRHLCPDAGPSQIYELAYRIHRAFQGGRGSGVDVAASTYGGVLAYTMPRADRTRELVEEPPNLRSLKFPDGVRIEAVWLGEPARSTSFVRAVERSLDAGVEDVLKQIAAVARGARRACIKNEGHRFIEALREADGLFDALDDAAGVSTVTDGHRALRDAASRYGFATKPSGAGGGDFSLVIGPPGEEWEYWEGSLPDGATYVPLSFGAHA